MILLYNVILNYLTDFSRILGSMTSVLHISSKVFVCLNKVKTKRNRAERKPTANLREWVGNHRNISRRAKLEKEQTITTGKRTVDY